MLFRRNKKSITEIISFVLLTLIIVLASSTAYFFSKNLIDSSITKLDRDNMLINLKLFEEKINSIQNFDDSTTSMNVNFRKGELVFKNNQIYYQSLENINGGTNCFEGLCYENINGFERIYFNLSNSYNFSNNVSLTPNLYKITFKNIKNESKIKITIK